MSNKAAIIDLGSNTFHLLIAEFDAQGFRELYRERDFVYLAKGGVTQIDEDRFQHGTETMKRFRAHCDQYGICEIHALGTSALRSASNAPAFLDTVRMECGIEIEIISGDREAELIQIGCMHFLDLKEKEYLIMDIGGGSVEFIAGNSREDMLRRSFTLGISQLRSIMQYSDPLTKEEHEELMYTLAIGFENMSFLNEFTQPLYLIGASGPFEIIESVNETPPDPSGNVFLVREVKSLIKKVVSSSKEARFAIKNMPPERADLSLESMLLIEYVLKAVPTIDKIMVSPFALKEGYLIERYF